MLKGVSINTRVSYRIHWAKRVSTETETLETPLDPPLLVRVLLERRIGCDIFDPLCMAYIIYTTIISALVSKSVMFGCFKINKLSLHLVHVEYILVLSSHPSNNYR